MTTAVIDAPRTDAEPSGVRRSARALHAACAELLPGYAAASREPWRQALLTAGCLDARPGRRAARRPAPPLIVEDVVQPSDVLCALWLARRSGLFSPGSSCGDAVGRRSACEIGAAGGGGQVGGVGRVPAVCLVTALGMGFPFERGVPERRVAVGLADRLGV